jgi:hypothetical protein
MEGWIIPVSAMAMVGAPAIVFGFIIAMRALGNKKRALDNERAQIDLEHRKLDLLERGAVEGRIEARLDDRGGY